MKICPLRAKLFRVDRRREMRNLIADFRNFANAPKNFSDKSYRENKNTSFMCNYFFSRKEWLCAVRWNNIVQPCRQRIKIWRMLIACWIPKATNAHSGNLEIIAFPLQQRLHTGRSTLRYTYNTVQYCTVQYSTVQYSTLPVLFFKLALCSSPFLLSTVISHFLTYSDVSSSSFVFNFFLCLRSSLSFVSFLQTLSLF